MFRRFYTTAVLARRRSNRCVQCYKPPTFADKGYARNNILSETIEKMASGLEFYAGDIEQEELQCIAAVQTVVIICTLAFILISDRLDNND